MNNKRSLDLRESEPTGGGDMPYLSLALLGPVSVSFDKQPLPKFQTERAKALLLFLATESALGTTVHRREALMELLWPGLPLKSARVSLRQTLYLLRQDMPGTQAAASLLLTDRYRVQLDPAYPQQVDVTDFLRLLDGPQKGWTKALYLYRGDFLADFYLADSAAFEEWAASRRAAFRRQALNALEGLTANRLEEGSFDEAEQYGRRQLEIDNLRESAYRQLMQAYAWSGRRSQALSLYEECSRLLNAELAAAPDPATSALRNAIRDNQLLPPPTTPLSEAMSLKAARMPTSPYRGLSAFREADAPFFFGREAFTDRLLAAVRRRPLVAVIGPSGGGKTSVVCAGLVASLRGEGGWLMTSFRPGVRPFHALVGGLIDLLEPDLRDTERLVETGKLARALEGGDLELTTAVEHLVDKHPAPESAATRLLLVADQLEELYTLVPDSALRRRFLDTLLEPISTQQFRPHPIFALVVTLRADFLGQALSYRPLADALHQASVTLGPMTRAELERAIVSPASRGGVAFAPGLVDRILDDVGDEPGNLPLLAFALDALWKWQDGGWLTHEGYEAIGKVEGALARYAGGVLSELEGDEQALARRIFVQLIHPGEGTEDTRRLATRQELGEEKWALVRRLADNRLLVTGRDAAGRETVEMVHEALIRGWDQLRDWLDEDRAFRVWQEQVRASLRSWLAHQRDDGALLQGLALATAEEWLERRPGDVSAAERDFVANSIALRERRQASEKRVRAERERLRRTRTWILGTGLVLVVMLALLAGLQWRRAEGRRQALADAQAAIVQERDLAQQALANHLAAEVLNLLSDQPSLALLLALEANKRSDIQAVRESLVTAVTNNPRFMAPLRAPEPFLSAVAISPDGRLLAAGGEGAEIQLWHVNSFPFAAKPLKPLTFQPSGALRALAFSPDGKKLALAHRDSVSLYDLAESSEPQAEVFIGPHDAVSKDIRDAAFSPDGETLALATGEGAILLWDLSGPRQVASLDVGSYLRAVAFTPDGERIVASSTDGLLVVWDLANEESRQAVTDMAIFDVATSPDGFHMALVGSPGRVELWRLDPLERVAAATSVEANILHGTAFHPDGRFVSAGNDGHLVLWRVDGSELIPEPLLAHRDVVRAVAFDPAGRWLAAADQGGLVTLWNAESNPTLGYRLARHSGAVQELAFRDNGRLTSVTCQQWTQLAIFPGQQECTWIETGIWHVDERPDAVRFRRLSDHPASIFSLGLAPDGQTAVLGYLDGSAALLDVAESQWDGVLDSQQGEPIASFAFDRSGSLLAAGGCLQRAPDGFCAEGDVRLWELEQSLPAQRTIRGFSGLPIWLALSPDGRWLASGLQLPSENVSGIYSLSWDLSQEKPEPGQLDSQGEFIVLGTFHPDSNLLAVSSFSGKTWLWRLSETVTASELASPVGSVTALAFSPDGRYLALGGCDTVLPPNPLLLLDCSAQLAVLDLETDRLVLQSFAGHTRAVLSLAFSSDGSLLASGDIGGDIMLWDLSITPEEMACRRAGRNLTADEWERYFGEEPYRPTCPDLVAQFQ